LPSGAVGDGSDLGKSRPFDTLAVHEFAPGWDEALTLTPVSR
jgi:hypothetical protein